MTTEPTETTDPKPEATGTHATGLEATTVGTEPTAETQAPKTAAEAIKNIAESIDDLEETLDNLSSLLMQIGTSKAWALTAKHDAAKCIFGLRQSMKVQGA